MSLVVIPPRSDGLYVLREIGQTVYYTVPVNPCSAVTLATNLDADLINMQTSPVNLRKLHKYDEVYVFVSVYDLENDLRFCRNFHNFHVVPSPLTVPVDELLPKTGLEREQVITDRKLFRGETDLTKLDWSKYSTEKTHIQLYSTCPFNCSFCCRANTYDGYVKPVEDVINEIKFVSKVGCHNFFLFATEFSLEKDYAFELCEKLEPLNIRWMTSDRLNLLDAELLGRMKKAGCESIEVGVETVFQDDLDSVDKGTTRETITQGINLINSYDMKVIAFLILGLPHDNFTRLLDALNLMNRLKVAKIIVNVLYPEVSSRLYREAKKEGMLKSEDWNVYKHPHRFRWVLKHGFYKNTFMIKTAKKFSSLWIRMNNLVRKFGA